MVPRKKRGRMWTLLVGYGISIDTIEDNRWILKLTGVRLSVQGTKLKIAGKMKEPIPSNEDGEGPKNSGGSLDVEMAEVGTQDGVDVGTKSLKRVRGSEGSSGKHFVLMIC